MQHDLSLQNTSDNFYQTHQELFTAFHKQRWIILQNAFFSPHFDPDEFLKNAHVQYLGKNNNERRLIKIISHWKLFLNADLTLKDFAKTIGMSPRNLQRYLRMQLNTTYCDFVNHLRLVSARKHLVESHDDIATLALQFGFSSHAYFSAIFKKKFDMSPLRYRKMHWNHGS